MSPPHQQLQVAGWWHTAHGERHGAWHMAKDPWHTVHGARCMAHVGWHTARGTRCHIAHGVRQLARREQHVGLGTASLRALCSTWQQHGTRHTPSNIHHGAHGTARSTHGTAHGPWHRAHSSRHMARGSWHIAHGTWHGAHGARLTARGRGTVLGRGRSTALSLPPLPWIFRLLRPAAQRGGSPVAGRLRHNFKAVAAPKHSSYKALLLLSPAGGFQVTNPC